MALYLEECGIQAQYTTPGTPEQNGVAKRRNGTLKEMVRSMMSRTTLPHFLWGEALKMANYVLNRVPSKAVNKTQFEIWSSRKPSLNHLRVWGCKAEARMYNPLEKKLESRTVSCRFIGFPEKSKGYKFYAPNLHTRVFETNNAKFIEEEISHDGGDLNSFIFEEHVDPTVFHGGDNQQGSNAMQTIMLEPEVLPPIPEIGGIINDHANEPMHEPVIEEVAGESPVINEIPRRASQRVRRSVISNDYVTYLTEVEHDEGMLVDPATYMEAMNSENFQSWKHAMEEEIKSMQINQVWSLVEKTNSIRPIGCKWVYKTKRIRGAKLKGLKRDWWQRVSTKRKECIITKLSHLFHQKILFV